MKITVNINNTEYQHDVEPRLSLVQYLREVVNLTGTHIGCDTSACGTCTVHFNGDSVKSCTLLAVQADGAAIMTIEGMAINGEMHPIQAAFKEKHGLQCGFCTPGMVMVASDIIRHHPKPTEEDIRHGLKGNFCRCTGYHNIIKSIQYAAQQING